MERPPLVIRCAQCAKPVDRVEVWDTPSSSARRFIAWCHGERDECELTYGFLAKVEPGSIVEAVAFQKHEPQCGAMYPELRVEG
jgi:hypothetical protein